ncbi:LysR family transcriptional regulator [Phreatobacter stygius]|uniref:LysR family transcriptional regulator n=1 Tax=Phreatobacter stygius TaxID=1940610 RepID=A0A4D7ATJ6_9HYPH|nr:LysR family transcriptional regulator [Phreatobacter stygius]QCI64864.1 LysR family transcriptional regulator [Phreatobacter stygius]
MRLDQLSGLIAFLKVAETKSFTRAAAELGVSPPSLSEAVRGLEARLGVRLLNRTTRSVGLTEAGAAYLDRVGPAAEEILTAGAALKETRDHPAGLLRISVPWIAGPLLMEPLMTPFLKAYPDVKLDLVFDDGFVDLAAEGFDAGIRIGELLEQDMIAVRVSAALRTAVVASPDYLARHGTPARPADLDGHACIAYRLASNRAIAPWDFVVDGRDIAYRPDPRLSANTMPLMVDAAARGLGLAFVVERLAAARIGDATLVKVLEAYCPAYDPLHIYYPSRRLTPPKLRAFVDFARSRR